MHGVPDRARAVRAAQARDDGHPQPDDAPARGGASDSDAGRARRAPAPAGSVGSGDLEVRERRARRTASERLAESHPEEFAMLLRDARAAEGLRPLSNGSPPDGRPPSDGVSARLLSSSVARR